MSDKIGMKSFILTFVCLMLASCSTLAPNPEVPVEDRAPAAVSISSCADMIKNFFSGEKSGAKNIEKDLNATLLERKLISRKDKMMMVQYPKLEWINKVKKSFNQSLRNWNNNRYPAFYTFNEEEIVPLAKRYGENLEKILTNQVPADDEETTKAFVAISDWMKLFSNYKTDMDQLIEERISLQYNINLLKKIKLPDNESQDVQITIKRAGALQTETVTLRKEDKNLDLTIKKLKKQIDDLDGTIIRNGKIKDRIVRQAMLQDMLTIVQREAEYASKNAAAPNEEVAKELEKLSALIKNSDFAPSTYGVYKINNKVFLRELIATSKLDVAYTKIKDPVNKIKTIVTDYFKNKMAGTDQEKIGILKKFYAKITNISAKQVTIGGGSVALAGIGVERYFWLKDKSVKEVGNGGPKVEQVDDVKDEKTEDAKVTGTEDAKVTGTENAKSEGTENAKNQSIETAKDQGVENPNDTALDRPASDTLSADDQAHQQQLEHTKKIEKDKNEGHSSVVEIQIDELTK